MKALDEYFLMVVFMLLLDRDNVFALFMLICTEKYGSEMDRDPIQCGKSGFAAKVWKGLTLNRIVSYFKRALLFFCPVMDEIKLITNNGRAKPVIWHGWALKT